VSRRANAIGTRFLRDLFRVFGSRPKADHYVRAGGGEQADRRRTDSARRAGDERTAPAKVKKSSIPARRHAKNL
jgi:hypothetical protein